MLNPYMFIQSSFNILRQGCATGILLFSIPFLQEKKWIQFIIIVILAAQFHNISYVFLLLIGVRMIPWDKRLFTIVLAISCISNVLLRGSNYLLQVLAQIFGYERYLGYRSSMLDMGPYVVFIVGVVIILLLYYEELYENEKDKFLIDLYILSLSLLPIFIKNAQLYRVYVVLAFMSLPAVSYVLRASRTVMGKKMCMMVNLGYYSYYLVFMGAFLAKMVLTDNEQYTPFVFFWNT